MEKLTLLTPEKLQSAVARIAASACSPARVILFGSQARGNTDSKSDLDLMVIERELPDKAAEYLRLKAAIGRMGVGVDLLLYSEAEFERRSQVPGTVPYWVSKEGKVLYDAAA
ncbi:MAG: nucleotidyltransferase domain-containing protein [Nitrosomonadales bacterium]|nr:nucleotidyltransferase domain-containing protein [Nitrosomonadales bacterium]